MNVAVDVLLTKLTVLFSFPKFLLQYHTFISSPSHSELEIIESAQNAYMKLS